jgi:hypothetical protein
MKTPELETVELKPSVEAQHGGHATFAKVVSVDER